MALTSIEWTEMTWNPITGCTKCSAGCQNCYAATFAKRLHAMGNKRYKNGFHVTVHKDLFARPLEWKTPKRIFVNSMSDLFHEDIPDEDILALFKLMNKAHWHIFQILTKRAERLLKLNKKISWTDNIWMGVSVENKDAVKRSKLLKKTDARIKFISAEPLLEAVPNLNLDGIDWLIVGGESGPRCRPIKEEWVIQLRDMAHETDTAFFFKQWGGIHKKANGKALRGQEYMAYPLH